MCTWALQPDLYIDHLFVVPKVGVVVVQQTTLPATYILVPVPLWLIVHNSQNYNQCENHTCSAMSFLNWLVIN